MHKKIAKLFILGAIASLFFRRGFMTPASIMPFEIFIFIAGLLTLYKIKLNKISYYLKLFIAFIVFISLGLLSGYALFYDGFNTVVIRGLILDYYFMSTGILAFLLIIYYGKDKKFLRNIFYAFLIPLMLCLLFIWQEPFFTKDFRLIGFHTDPTMLGTLLTITFACIISLFFRGKKLRKKILLWFVITILLSLILWTGTRSTWVAISFIMLFILIKETIIKTKRIKPVMVLGLWSITTLAIAFLILPNNAKNMIVMRIFPQFLEPLYAEKQIVDNLDAVPESIKLLSTVDVPGVKQKNFINTIRTIRDVSEEKEDLTFEPGLAAHDRQSFLPRAIKVGLLHPFGLGTQFYRLEGSITVREFPAGPHNTFLFIMISGGIFALIIFIILLYEAFKSLKLAENKNTVWLGITLSFIGVFVSMFLDDRLFIPWIWIIPALAIAWPEKII